MSLQVATDLDCRGVCLFGTVAIVLISPLFVVDYPSTCMQTKER